MKNVIVTGGAGALGHAVVEQLITDKHRVAVVDMAKVGPVGAALFLGGVDLADDTAVHQTFAVIAKDWVVRCTAWPTSPAA